MKKAIIILLLVSVIATPSYALNIIDKLMYKKDVLLCNNTPVLVNRLTGEVKYIYRSDGQTVLLEGQWKEQYQNMYNAQNAPKKPASVQ